MKLFSEFYKVFQIDNISISERLNTAEASFTTKFQILPSIEAIRSLCNLIPDRDDFCLTFKNDSDDIVYVTNQSFALLDFSILTENLSLEDDIDVKIQIDKKVSDGKFSIYDFSSFSKDLSQRPILEILRWFSNQLHRERSNLRYTMMIFHFRLEPWYLNLLKMLHSSPKSIEISG